MEFEFYFALTIGVPTAESQMKIANRSRGLMQRAAGEFSMKLFAPYMTACASAAILVNTNVKRWATRFPGSCDLARPSSKPADQKLTRPAGGLQDS